MVTIHWVQSMCFAQVRFHLIPVITRNGVGTFLVMWMLKKKGFKWPAQHSSGSRTRTQYLNLGKMPCFWFPLAHHHHYHCYSIGLGQVRESCGILVGLFVLYGCWWHWGLYNTSLMATNRTTFMLMDAPKGWTDHSLGRRGLWTLGEYP